MDLKKIAAGGALAVAAAAAWEYRDSETVLALLQPKPTRPVAIEFDNGTVRQYEAASQPAGRPAPVPRRADGLKKCRRGAETIYTNFDCPPGSKPEALAGGTLSVMGGGAVQPKPMAAATADGRRSTLHDALDLSGNENLRDKRMERLIEHGSTR